MNRPGSLIAIDVGGTAIKTLITDNDGIVLSRHHFPTERDAGPNAVIDKVLHTVDHLISLTGEQATAIGLVVPGIVDEENGIALNSENIGWNNVPFRDLVSLRTGLPVGFGHDVRAGGLAEKVTGSGRGFANVFFMPIGTGISGAIFIDSQLLRNMNAGEIGHVDVGSGEKCACGSSGCLETVSSGPSIVRRFFRASGTHVDGAKEVVELAESGDIVAQEVWKGAIDALVSALTTYVSLLAPDLIVIGGGLSQAGTLLMDPLRDRLNENLTWQKMPQVARAQHGEYAAAHGAAILARDALATASRAKQDRRYGARDTYGLP